MIYKNDFVVCKYSTIAPFIFLGVTFSYSGDGKQKQFSVTPTEVYSGNQEYYLFIYAHTFR